MFFAQMRRPVICLYVVLLWAAATETFALQPATPLTRFPRQSWGMENGLPQNTVSVLLQSRSGFLWAGTELGLARFDGVNFRIFDHATAVPFPDAEIRCLLDAEDKDNSDGSENGKLSSGDSLWVGTGDGLVRWQRGRSVLLTTRDGLPANSIRGLVRTTDGAVWVWTEAGLARWTGQHFQAVDLAKNLSRGGITSIAADASGGLWVGTTLGAVVFRDGHWLAQPDSTAEKNSRHGASSGANSGPPGHPSLVASVGGGDVLIATAGGVFLEHKGTIANVLADISLPADGVSFLSRLADGTVAVASKSTVVLVQAGHVDGRFAVSQQLPGSRIETIFADREGSLWVGTNRGLARISLHQGTGAVERFPPADPLAANAVVALLEDREGDLWVGTEAAGMHILRDARFRIVGSSDGLSSDAATAIVQDSRDTIWIGTRDSGLNSIPAGPNRTPATLTTADGLLSNVILALAASPSGELWAGTPDGLNRVSAQGISVFTSADGLPDDFIRSLLVAPDSSIWIGTRRGLTHLEHGRFQTLTQSDGLGSDLVGALARTADGDLWIATLNGLSRLHPGSDSGRLRNYTTADGLSSNVITALEATPDGMLWIGTQNNGLNLWDGTRFTAIPGNSAGQNTADLPGLPQAIRAILQDDRGHIWLASDGLASNAALTRVDTQPLLDCARLKKCSLNAANLTTFTTADGLRSRETSSNSHPTAVRTHNGQLWFATPRGVAVVDPLHFAANPTPTPVIIERFAVDDRDMDAREAAGKASNRDQNAAGAMRITAGALRFQFDYAGLSFAAPQKLRYQYTLEGFDHAWTDAGTRRTAYYTNIPPGQYRFRVRVSSGQMGVAAPSGATGSASDVLYNDIPGAAFSFELLPHFYQTVWFWTLVVLLIAGLVLLVFRRRVLRVELEFRAVMAERNRIAREIHDTLAQGYVGISLQLEILGELLRHNRSDAAAKHLTVTQGLVREGLDDARQSIWALRSQDSGETTLPIRLRRQMETAQDRDMTADLEVHGAYRALSSDVEKEILRIAQEAIQNTKRHAAASQIRVRLEYDERALTLTISDNGKGFALLAPKRRGKQVAARSAAANAGEGHYGLTGMQERAAVIHAELAIESEPGKGTTVRLNVPAPEASARSRSLPADFANQDILLPGATEASLSEIVSITDTETGPKKYKE